MDGAGGSLLLMASRTLRMALVGTTALATITVFVACSSKDALPPTSADLPPEAVDAALTPRDAATEAGQEAGADGGAVEVPKSCTNTIKDGKETDVDCGGVDCAKCIDGKRCVASTDCRGGSCVNNACVTAACTDNVTNGDESDIDCGGSTCSRCTTGKKCSGNADCLSNSCVNQACACPSGMAIVAKASGGAYCIDQGQYNKFLTANQPVEDQIAVCKAANPTFVPRGAWPPATTPSGLAHSNGLPVHYVDWCDGYAYCRWANKQLCGQINGGAIGADAGTDARVSAWYNACSAQGTRAWPYSTSFDQLKCNGNGGEPGASYGSGGANQDDNIYRVNDSDTAGNLGQYVNTGCQGGSVGVYQMSGNVQEWEDSCDAPGDTNTSCKLRGGSYKAANNPDELGCATVHALQRVPGAAPDPATDPLKDVGFRCCLY